MSPGTPAFEVGSNYSNEEIYRSLSVGNAGGIRAKVDEAGCVDRLVIMTSVPSARQLCENPYHDRLEGDVLIYTGAGRAGDQSVAGSNARIVQQLSQPFPIYGFMLTGSRRKGTVGNKRWAFLGLLECCRFFQERQIDAANRWRNVWVFELRVHTEPPTVEPALDREIMGGLLADRTQLAVAEDREVVSSSTTLKNDFADSANLEILRKQLLAVHPRQFERVIGQLLERCGFEQVEVTKYSQGGGIDLNARPGAQCWPMKQILIQIQAKRWIHTVGRKEIAELRGSLLPHATGCVVTTSHFSRAALKEAGDVMKRAIGVVDGYELARAIELNELNIADLQ